jgi:hypothetical protein
VLCLVLMISSNALKVNRREHAQGPLHACSKSLNFGPAFYGVRFHQLL